MKTKSLKKLGLNKFRVGKLNNEGLQKIKGGYGEDASRNTADNAGLCIPSFHNCQLVEYKKARKINFSSFF